RCYCFHAESPTGWHDGALVSTGPHLLHCRMKEQDRRFVSISGYIAKIVTEYVSDLIQSHIVWSAKFAKPGSTQHKRTMNRLIPQSSSISLGEYSVLLARGISIVPGKKCIKALCTPFGRNR